MSDDSKKDSDDRSHAPTAQKLDRSRKEGEVAYSTEVTTAATYAALYAVILVAGGACITRVGAVLHSFLSKPHEIGRSLLAPSPTGFLDDTVAQLVVAMAPIFGALALAAAASILAQRAVVIAPKKLLPKLNRLSIIDNAKQKYGPQGMFEFLKSFAKLSAIFAILAFALRDKFLELPGLAALPAQAFSTVIYREAVFFLGLVTIAAVIVAAVDLPWRRYRHEKRLMMTHDELRKENKESEGDPALKGARRERATALARNQMMADVPKANVVIVNPSHYAVALQWERNKGAPICVAKGVDAIAARIREIAAESGVPIRRDPPTARSIYALVEIGEEIKREHFAAVAAAIYYAQEIQRKSAQGYAQ